LTRYPQKPPHNSSPEKCNPMLSGYILVTINQLNSRDKIENARNETHILCSEFIF